MRTLALLPIAVAALAARDARACSFAAPAPFEPQAASGSDTVPPSPPVLVRTGVSRAKGTPAMGCGATSCDDIASIRIDLQPGTDDVAGAIGYRVRVTDGTRPDGRSDLGGNGPVQPGKHVNGEHFLSFHWSESDPEAPLDLVFHITTVDNAGNESQPLIVPIKQDVGGCRSVPSASLLLLAVPLATMRRRRVRQPRA